jgi:hypothetical protein
MPLSSSEKILEDNVFRIRANMALPKLSHALFLKVSEFGWLRKSAGEGSGQATTAEAEKRDTLSRA